MKIRMWLMCVLFTGPGSLFAQTLTMTDSWDQQVTAQAQNVTANSPIVSSALLVNSTWDSKLPANGNTLLKIAFLQGTTYVGETPIVVTNVANAKLWVPNPPNTSPQPPEVYLTPVKMDSQKDVAEANRFLATKVPTKDFCLTAKSGTYKGRRGIILANGLVLVATGKIDLLPKEGQKGCVCGRGLAPAEGSDIEIFEVKSRCVVAAAKKK